MNETERICAPQGWRALPRAVRAAFLCCFVAGYLAHLFAMTNLIPNSDGISRVADAQQMTVSGRWFLHYASAWHGYVQSPAVIGFFAMLFLSLAAALTVSLLKIEHPCFGGLCGALLAVFPSMAYTFLYLFTASAYCFGILLAVLAVWLVSRSRFGFLFAAPVLACAVGTYQAYLAVAAALSLMVVILNALDGSGEPKRIVLDALRHLAFLVLGLALYYLVLRIFLWAKELTLLDYKGLNGAFTDLTFGGAVGLVASAYREFFRYYFVPNSFAAYTTPLAVLGHAALAAAGGWALFRTWAGSGCRRHPAALALILVLLALLPLAANLTVLMADAMPITRYALVLPYLLALALTERAVRGGEAASPAQKKTDVRSALRLTALCASALLVGVSFFVDNLAYTVSATAHRATESFATRLVERVEATPGYRNGMEIVVIGGFPSQVYSSQIEAFSIVTDYSNLSSSVIPLNKHVYYYLNDWLNVPWAEPDEATMQAVSDSAAFQAMPLYPDDGSVVVEGDRVVVKLAPAYVPRQPYEIAYENRR